MGTTTALRQLLKSLCHNTQWKYAVLWKLKHQNHMLLTWEDGYIDTEKSGGFLSGKPGIISFGCEMDAQNGNSVGCPIEMAVANMSCCSYTLGEGIVGTVAARRKHHWTFANEFNSRLWSEFPEEWQLQFEAGIKTILLVPVITLGVVQLGSLDTVLEDLTEVVRIGDLFGTIQHIAGTCISLAPRMDHLDPYTPFTMPSVGNLSASSVITDDLPNLVRSQIPPKKDSAAYDFGLMTKNELPTSMSHLVPPFMVQADLPLPVDVVNQILGVDTSPCTDESTWKATFSNLFVDHIEDPCVLNQSVYTNNITEGDMSIFSCIEDELNVISSIGPKLTSKQSVISNSYMKDHYDMGLGMEFDEEANSIIDHGHLNFSFDSELHKALGLGSLKEHDDCVWKAILSKADEWSSSTAICQTELPEVYSPSFEEVDAWFTKERGTEQLLDAVIADLLNASDDNVSGVTRCLRSCSNSSGKCSDSCLTHYKTEEDSLGLEDSVAWSQKSTMLTTNNEGFMSSPTRSSDKSIISMFSVQEGQQDMAYGLYKRGPKSSHSSRRRGNSSNIHRPKPRDRQLIQDRIKELRELIPNASKCSIDALLDRTIKHMVFLQSIPCQAEKLRHSAHPKVKGEDWNSSGAHSFRKGASWVYELGCQSRLCPLTVENLDQPGQMLVEMQCEEYGLFLEIAGVIKRLKLTILKGILETQADKLWAHFIIETPRGFHRMDILWPLMQLLQCNNPPLPTMF